MATKDGKAYLTSLRDDRSIYIDGRKVADVTTDPCFRNVISTTASLYDYQAAPENLDTMTFKSPDSGERVNLSWLLPKTYGDLVRRRAAIEKWSTLSCGMFGRSPDHVASTLAGFRMGLQTYRDYDPARAAALESYFRYARDNDLFLSYVIINPQSDKAK